VHEVIRIDRDRLGPETLGLSLAEAKAITGGIQQVLAGSQVAQWQQDRRACPSCGRRRSLKGHHPLIFRTPFGVLRLDSERLRTCRCAQRPPGSVSPLAELLHERVSPEMLYLQTKFASLISYGLFRVAEAHEAELALAPTSITLDERTAPDNPPPDGPPRTLSPLCDGLLAWRRHPRDQADRSVFSAVRMSSGPRRLR
jgi:hypothetical protein